MAHGLPGKHRLKIVSRMFHGKGQNVSERSLTFERGNFPALNVNLIGLDSSLGSVHKGVVLACQISAILR